MHVTPLLVYVATTVKVATNGPLVLLIPVNGGMPPVPDTGPNPMLSPVLVQLNTAPGTLLIKKIGGTFAPAQNV